MKVEVIGGGSIGLLFGGRLAEAGAEVTIWTKSEMQAEKLNQHGIGIETLDGSERYVPVRSASVASVSERQKTTGHDRYLFLTVKQTDLNDELLDRIEELAQRETGETVAVICLQNGIGHLERISNRLRDTLILAGVTTEGAKRLDSCSVRHTGKGQLWIGEWDENKRKHDQSHENMQKLLITLLQSAGFDAFLSNDMKNRIYNKLLINAVINPLTAIFDVLNGDLPSHPSRVSLMRALYMESELILQREGMKLEEDGWSQILEVCHRTSGNVSSMLSDVRNNRKTEIDAINGSLVRIAEKQQQPAPLNRAITELIRAIDTKSDMRE